MAITQYSQINARSGLQQDLPQLSGGELGWAVDSRRLYIGNGELADGAPEIGNTEILTIFSDIFELAGTYRYQGSQAGYPVSTTGSPAYGTGVINSSNPRVITSRQIVNNTQIEQYSLIAGTYIPDNTIVTIVGSGDGTITISQDATGLAGGDNTTEFVIVNGVTVRDLSSSAAIGNVMLDFTNTAGISVGDYVSNDPAIAVNTTVTAITPTSVTISNPVAGSGIAAGNFLRFSRSSVTRTLQEKLDDTVSVRDFGAAGDGVTVDDDAINKALNQLYCVQDASDNSNRSSRALLFPAGTYLITDTLRIPPGAKLIGEGINHSVIRTLYSNLAVAATTADFSQETGNSIYQGIDDDKRPGNVVIESLTIVNTGNQANSVCLQIEQAKNVRIKSVGFAGNTSIATNNPSANIANLYGAGINFSNVTANVNPCQNIFIDNCSFEAFGNCVQDTGTTLNTVTADGNFSSRAVSITNSNFKNSGRGIYSTGASFAWIIADNTFDNLNGALGGSGICFANTAIPFPQGQLISSSHNIFTRTGTGGNIVYFGQGNCLSSGDLFDAPFNASSPRVIINTGRSIAIDGTDRINLGQRVIGSTTDSLPISVNTANSLLNLSNYISASFDTIATVGYKLQASGMIGGNSVRYLESGTITLVNTTTGNLTYNKESQAVPGFAFPVQITVTQAGNGDVLIGYDNTTANANSTSVLSGSIKLYVDSVLDSN